MKLQRKKPKNLINENFREKVMMDWLKSAEEQRIFQKKEMRRQVANMNQESLAKGEVRGLVDLESQVSLRDRDIACRMGIMAQMEQANKIRYNQFSQKDLEEMLNKMADLSIDWEAGKTKRHPKRKLPWQE